MFGAAVNLSDPTSAHHHETVFESFYRLRLTPRVDLGPDVEVSIHPMNAERAYTTTLVSGRLRTLF